MKAMVAGLINIETNVRVNGFPIEYFPIDYPFFGVEQSVGGVGYNISKALLTLGDEVQLHSFTGNDLAADVIHAALKRDQIDTAHIRKHLKATPASAVLYDAAGKRQVYCDLKDVQEQSIPECEDLSDADICILCNANFNRQLLRSAKAAGKTIATDVHVLSDPEDAYNRDFMEYADILFLSNESIPCSEEDFLRGLAQKYAPQIIVMGKGSRGISYYDQKTGKVQSMPAAQLGNTVNTIGAGDALFSSFLHFYTKGVQTEEALMKAQIFAAKKIQCNGAANGFVTEDAVEEIFSSICA